MDPLTALGLASNVVQFVQFASNLVKIAVEVRRSSSGCTDDILTLDTLYGQLNDFNSELLSGRDNASSYLNGPGSKSNKNSTSLRTLSLLCQSDCEKLLLVVRKLKVQDGSRGRWQSFRTALKSLWEKEDIEDLERRLQRTQMTMTFHICALASHAQEVNACRLTQLQTESNRLQFDQSVKIDRIMAALDDFRLCIQLVQNANQESPPSVKEIDSLEQHLSGLSLSQKTVEKEQAILKSLSFDARPVRHTSISEAHQRTFRWAYEPDENAPAAATFLPTWLKRGNGVFWVSGKPGSGKSTFMKFIADEPMTLDFLSEWSGSKRTVISSHYFWSAGTAMQKSQHGLLRTLLHGIFRQCSELIEPVCESMQLSLDNAEDLLQWSLSTLKETLRKVACWDKTPVQFCFFVDGLDEYDGDHPELCQVLKDVAKSPNIKICLSSRPWNVFEEAFGSETQNKLYIQDLTRNDILEYIRSRLYEHPRWPALATRASQGDSLIKDIEKRACGVFLWVFLVTRLLREGLTNRDSFMDIRRRLESFPEELEIFFRQILESVEPFYHNKMSTTMQIAIAAKEPLHAMAYGFHDQEYEDEDYVFGVPVLTYNRQEEQELREETAWRLNSRSRGLLELNPQSGTVTFLHRTVLDFLRTQEMSTFLAGKAPSRFNLTSSLLKVYTSMIKRTHFEECVVRHDFGAYKNCYLQFLTTNALACAAELEESATPSTMTYKILEDLDRSLLNFSHLKNLSRGQVPGSFVREQLIKGQHMGYLAWKLPEQPDYLSSLGPSLIPCILVPEGAHSKPTLDQAWQNRGVEMLRLVVETQDIDPNEKRFNTDPRQSWSGWTALISHITSWTRGTNPITEAQFWDLLGSNIISKLLDKGADPNIMLWCNHLECWPAFAAYLNLAFEVPSDTAREALYIRVLGDFLFAGATMDISHTEFTNRSIQQRLGKTVKIASSSKKFFGRLQNIHTLDPLTCNFRLLGEVVDMLLSTVVNSEETWIMAIINTAVETVFPSEICSLLKNRYTAIMWAYGADGRKRRGSPGLERGLNKRRESFREAF
ncbi:hypothetical protein N7517_009701 [Penicillium concentricum]|uniref:NACHT domain-containing protein n=1 Tax=Penicillium concentricum TaxID=293559 RepID=A0A9W9RJ55_9EURO|nr:uncharacterized protein N7517_009701 [Penicillium concentricum]KAJ5360510.1 hypothetical protein N7517_009701 [Penicillium concentricum]